MRKKPSGFYLIILLMLSLSARISAQDYEFEMDQVYRDVIYDAHIKTVLIHGSGSELEPPIINLRGNEKLVLRFDDLGEQMREMHYTIDHCTYDWKKSDLQRMDYQQGFNSDIITDYDFSFNTVTPYTHYRLELPNDRVQLTRSGNYVVRVYANGNPEEILLTSRFMIVEPLAQVSALVQPSNVVSEREYEQEVDVTVTLGNIQTMNPYDEIELVVMQNLRRDNAIYGVKPNFIKNNKLVYDYQGLLSFGGGNEFRFFDAKSLRYRSEEIEEVRMEEDRYHIYLAPDVRKAFMQYSFENDINGKFLIRNDDMLDPHLESDYVTVHFMLPVDAMLGKGDLYLMGQLTNWELSEDFRLEYNYDNLSYELAVPLKQGYYNYAYLWKYKSQDEGEWDLTDGNHSETENSYTVLVYFKDRSAFSDRLIAVETVNTLEN
jgi:hypothetical protein